MVRVDLALAAELVGHLESNVIQHFMDKHLDHKMDLPQAKWQQMEQKIWQDVTKLTQVLDEDGNECTYDDKSKGEQGGSGSDTLAITLVPNAQHADLIDLEESSKAAAPPSSPRKERSRSEESLKPRSESDASKKRLSNKFEKLKTQLSSMSDHEIRTVVVAAMAVLNARGQ